MKGLIVLRPAGLRSLWRVTTANNYTNKTMLYDALERCTPLNQWLFYHIFWNPTLYSGSFRDAMATICHSILAHSGLPL